MAAALDVPDCRLSLWAGIGFSESKSSWRVVVVSVAGVLGSYREGDDTTPAGREKAAERWSARAMGPETGNGGTDPKSGPKTATLASTCTIFADIKISQHMACKKNCISNSESGLEWTGSGLHFFLCLWQPLQGHGA